MDRCHEGRDRGASQKKRKLADDSWKEGTSPLIDLPNEIWSLILSLMEPRVLFCRIGRVCRHLRSLALGSLTEFKYPRNAGMRSLPEVFQFLERNCRVQLLDFAFSPMSFVTSIDAAVAHRQLMQRKKAEEPRWPWPGIRRSVPEREEEEEEEDESDMIEVKQFWQYLPSSVRALSFSFCKHFTDETLRILSFNSPANKRRHSITGIYLHGCVNMHLDSKSIPYLPGQLRAISLPSILTSDLALLVDTIPTISLLDLSYCQDVTDRHIAVLQHKSTLQTLKLPLHHIRVPRLTIDCLDSLPKSLRQLGLGGLPVSCFSNDIEALISKLPPQLYSLKVGLDAACTKEFCKLLMDRLPISLGQFQIGAYQFYADLTKGRVWLPCGEIRFQNED